MATLTRELVSVEQAQAWLTTYEPTWTSAEIITEITHELRTGRKRRWYNALIVDPARNIVVDGLHHLLRITREQRPQRCWIARSLDFAFCVTQIVPVPGGREIIERKMDTVRVHRYRVERIVNPEDGRTLEHLIPDTEHPED